MRSHGVGSASTDAVQLVELVADGEAQRRPAQLAHRREVVLKAGRRHPRGLAETSL